MNEQDSPLCVINPYMNIPDNMVVKGAIDITYRIGISPLKRGDSVEPRWHKAMRYSILICYSIYAFRCMIYLLLYNILSEEQTRIVIYLGDVSYYFRQMRTHWNLILMNTFTCMFIIHIFHHKADIGAKSRWLKLLDCLTGSVPPSKIGMTNVHDIKQILKR